MSIKVTKLPAPCTLVHPITSVQYDFRPVGPDEVNITHKNGRGTLSYCVPTAEARKLYARLRYKKGYEPF